jgi:Chagasin family peptidase inhibitor I42
MLLASIASASGTGDPTGTTNAGAAATLPAPPVYSDPRKPIQVALGHEFVIALPADPRSGLSWQPITPPDPSVLLSIGSAFRTGGTIRGVAQVQQVLLFGGRGYGTTTIRLRYARPKAGSPVLRTVVFTVTVINPLAPPPPPTTTTTTVPTGSVATVTTSPTATAPATSVAPTSTFAPTTSTTIRATTTTAKPPPATTTTVKPKP